MHTVPTNKLKPNFKIIQTSVRQFPNARYTKSAFIKLPKKNLANPCLPPQLHRKQCIRKKPTTPHPNATPPPSPHLPPPSTAPLTPPSASP